MTDHRINLTLHNLQGVMDGEFGSLIEALVVSDQAERLKQEVEN